MIVFLFAGIHGSQCRPQQALLFNAAHSEYLCYLPGCSGQPDDCLTYLNLSTKSHWWWNRLWALQDSSMVETGPTVQISNTSWFLSSETNVSFPTTENPT